MACKPVCAGGASHILGMAGSWMKLESGTELKEPSALGCNQLKQSLNSKLRVSSAKSKIHLALNSAEEHRL